jgi:hypothetical protein
MVVALCTMSLLIAWFALALSRQRSNALGWPVVRGRIQRSGVESFRGSPSEDSSTIRTLYRSQISYSYAFKGVKYSSEKINFGGTITATTDWFARRRAAKYPTGKTVDVYVNPQNASEAVLEPKGSQVWWIWLFPIALLGFAWFVAQQP